MREILVGTIVLGSLLPSHLSAQRSSLTARGGGPVHFAGSTVVPPLRGVVPPLGSTHTGVRFFNARQNRFRAGHQGGSQFGYPFWGYGDWGYGDFYGGDYLNGYQAQAQPSVVVVAPQMAMPPLLPPPPPPRPEIRDYTWPD